MANSYFAVVKQMEESMYKFMHKYISTCIVVANGFQIEVGLPQIQAQVLLKDKNANEYKIERFERCDAVHMVVQS